MAGSKVVRACGIYDVLRYDLAGFKINPEHLFSSRNEIGIPVLRGCMGPGVGGGGEASDHRLIGGLLDPQSSVPGQAHLHACTP